MVEDVFTAVDVGEGYVDLLVESARSDCCWVEGVFMIGSSDYQNVVSFLKPIHLREQLVNGSSRGTVLGVEPPAFAQQRVDLVYEYDAGLVLPGFIEQLPDALSSHAHEHLVEVGASAVNEVAAGLASDSAGQEGLTGTWLAVEEHATMQVGAFGVVSFGVLHHSNKVVDFFFDLVDALDITELLVDVFGLFDVEFVVFHERLVVKAFEDHCEYQKRSS